MKLEASILSSWSLGMEYSELEKKKQKSLLQKIGLFRENKFLLLYRAEYAIQCIWIGSKVSNNFR